MFWKSRKPYKVRMADLMSTIIYEEEGRRMQVAGEKIGGEVGMTVYTRTMRWQPPHESTIVTDAEKERIKMNISEALSDVRFVWE